MTENHPQPGPEPDPILDAISEIASTMGRPSTDQVEYVGRTMLGLNAAPDSPDVDPKTLADQTRAAAVVRSTAEKFNSSDATERAEAARTLKVMLDASIARDEGRLDSFDPNSPERFMEDPLSGEEIHNALGTVAGLLAGDMGDVIRDQYNFPPVETVPSRSALLFEDDEHAVAGILVATWLGMSEKIQEDGKLITPDVLIGGEHGKRTVMQAVLEDDTFATGTRAQRRDLVERVWEKLPLIFQAAVLNQRAQKTRFRQQMDE